MIVLVLVYCDCHWWIKGTSFTRLTLKNYKRWHRMPETQTEINSGVNWKTELLWVRMENREDMETVAAILDTSLRKFLSRAVHGEFRKRINGGPVSWTSSGKTPEENRKALRPNVPAHRESNWESYWRTRSKYEKMIRSAKVNSWKRFCEFVDKIAELERVNKVPAKDREAVEEPL